METPKKHPGGAPRTVTPPKEQVIELGKEMVAYVQDNCPLHLSFWYRKEKKMSPATFKELTKRAEFAPYYQEALGIVSEHYLNGNVAAPIAQRFLRRYFDDMRDQEDQDLRDRLEIEKEKIKFEYDLKQKQSELAATEVIQQMATLMNEISLAQGVTESSDLNSSNINSNADCKS